MEKKEIQIPKGCKKIQIDIEDGVMVVFYESNINSRVFNCPETGEQEERPGIGDFCIFWNRGSEDRAVCANLEKNKNCGYVASNRYEYEEAIKFRNYEQYLRVKKEYGD